MVREIPGPRFPGWQTTVLTPRFVKHSFTCMVKTLSRIGNSQGLIFDAALLELAHLKVGDQVNITVHEGGAIVLTPLRPVIEPTEAAASAKRLIGKNRELFRRLSE